MVSLYQFTKVHNMFKKGVLADKPFFQKLLILVGIEFIFVGISSVLGILLVYPLFAVSPFELQGIMSNPAVNLNGVAALKFLQFVQASFVFILGPLTYVYFVTNDAKAYLNWKLPTQGTFLGLALVVMVIAGPMISALVLFNEQLKMPEFLAGLEQWMKNSEEQAELLTKAFLQTSTLTGLFINIIIVAALAGIGEELLFRGVIQKMLHDKTRNIHTAIIITGVLFSAIHMQFYGFLPRMVMGIMLGYMYYWSGSLMVSMLAHIVNNGFTVVMTYLYNQHLSTINPDDDSVFPWYGMVLSALLVGNIAYYFYKNREIEVLRQD